MEPERIAELVSQGYRMKYGKMWSPQGGKPVSDILIEFQAFRHKITGPECPGQFAHFQNIVNAIWNNKASTKKFVWNPWSDRMLRAACEYDYLGVAGSRSSGKSDAFALWGIVNFLAAPNETKVIYTSTSLKDSRGRIWGSVSEYWQAACAILGGEINMPGELVSSQGLIRFRQGGQQSDKCGLSLVAGEKTKEKEAIGKLIGFKAQRLLLIADELPELSESLIAAAESNLSGNPEFSMVGLGNPASMFDPFGVFCEPKTGWASLSDDTDEWETKRGFCIRLNGEKSPNILAGKTLYPWMLTEEKLEEARRFMGAKSQLYCRMITATWSATGASDSIYTEADIVAYKANAPAIWQSPPTMVAGFDPAFSDGGDRSILFISKFGVTHDGVKTLEFVKSIELDENTNNKKDSRTDQIVTLLIEHCRKEGVHPRNLAIDGTGAGAPFCDVVKSRFSGEFLEVNFGGKASEMPASGVDATPSSEVYQNKISEMWFVGREYIRSGQIRGLFPALSTELCSRSYTTKARGKIQIESKTELRKRIGKSPDMSDAALLTLELCRRRLSMSSKARSTPVDAQLGPRKSAFKTFATRLTKLRKW
jgi:hypothetical protein